MSHGEVIEPEVSCFAALVLVSRLTCEQIASLMTCYLERLARSLCAGEQTD